MEEESGVDVSVDDFRIPKDMLTLPGLLDQIKDVMQTKIESMNKRADRRLKVTLEWVEKGVKQILKALNTMEDRCDVRDFSIFQPRGSQEGQSQRVLFEDLKEWVEEKETKLRIDDASVEEEKGALQNVVQSRSARW